MLPTPIVAELFYRPFNFFAKGNHGSCVWGSLLSGLHKLGERQTENAKDIDMDACQGLLRVLGRNATDPTENIQLFTLFDTALLNGMRAMELKPR